MIDRQELRKVYNSTVLTCAGVTIVPLVLVFVAARVYSPGSLASGEPGSGTLPLVQLAVFAAMALSPLITVPLVRASLRQQSQPKAATHGAVVPKPEALMSMQAVVLYALWEISSMMGFVAFFLGAPWSVLLAAVAFTYVGYAITFPRWSAWQLWADNLDARRSGLPDMN